jgi:hypothetical protein
VDTVTGSTAVTALIESKIDKLAGEVHELRDEMREGFKQVNAALATLTDNQHKMETRLSVLEQKVTLVTPSEK